MADKNDKTKREDREARREERREARETRREDRRAFMDRMTEADLRKAKHQGPWANQYRVVLANLREVAQYFGDEARNDGASDDRKQAFLEAETKLTTALGELDYVVNLQTTASDGIPADNPSEVPEA